MMNEGAGIAHRCEGDYLAEISDVWEEDLRAGHPLPDSSYVNSDKAPMTGSSGMNR